MAQAPSVMMTCPLGTVRGSAVLFGGAGGFDGSIEGGWAVTLACCCCSRGGEAVVGRVTTREGSGGSG